MLICKASEEINQFQILDEIKLTQFKYSWDCSTS